MEKPFGHDVASAKALNAALHEHFDEDQIFRIDHFLGKEAAQDVLALRFANGLFEPIWNRQPRRAGPDRRSRGARAGGPRVVLRGDGRVPRHGGHAPVPGPGLRGDGAAGVAGRRAPARRARRRRSPRCGRSPPRTRSTGSSRATATRTAWRGTRASRRSSRCARGSTTSAGGACRSYLRTGKAMAQGQAHRGDRAAGSAEGDLYDGEHAPNIISFELLDDPQLARPGPRQGARPDQRRRPDRALASTSTAR